jgi:hypothetical protein
LALGLPLAAITEVRPPGSASVAAIDGARRVLAGWVQLVITAYEAGLVITAHQPGDGPSDDHALDHRSSFEYREARGGADSFRR